MVLEFIDVNVHEYSQLELVCTVCLHNHCIAMCSVQYTNLTIVIISVRSLSKTPHLIQDNAITPHVTCCSVLPK